ncbi:glycoside hydrolase family 9 protein [Streptomyces sp. NPDC058653]|uniref:glycoside hydrolase family 9 protein n=1 Tax=Streptomyces sp. NPDC058653 TaxID=3346576 RepID=UPI00365F1C74
MRPSLFSSLSLALAAAAMPAVLGQTAVGAPAGAADPGPVRVNQIGYATGADKIATVVAAARTPLKWRLKDDRGRTVASGTTRVVGADKASGDHVHQADFSRATGQGVRRLTVAGAGTSVPFTVTRRPLYPDLGREAMQYFYFHRMGTPVRAEYLQHAAHAHAALHTGDNSVPCYKNWCGKDPRTGRDQRLDVSGSWADAGDFGVYPVNHAIAAWTLLNLYERDNRAYGDGSLALPERANGVPDILDEVAHGSRFMAGMLPATGLASHKVHNHTWSPFPVKDIAAENAMPRSAMPPSTNATYAVARTNAQLARVLRKFDARKADRLWASARDAWRRAEARPDVDYPEANDGTDAEGGGDYPDTQNSDDRYAAAAELYLTAERRADRTARTYRDALTRSPHYGEIGPVDWGRVAAAGTLSLLAVENGLPAADLARMRAGLRAVADTLVTTQRGEGYPALLPGAEPYPWGSNSAIVNRMMLLGTAYDIGHDRRHLKAMHRAMDYLLGTNALRISYVTGYGAHRETDLHDRLAWGQYPATPYPKGWLSGGPNSVLINDPVTPKGRPAAKSYAGPGTAPSAWGSKENTVNWNAPLVWVATYLKSTAPDLASR